MSYRGSLKITVVSVGLSVHQFNFYFCPNLSKKGTKWSQNSVLRIFWKILSLVFIGNNLKWKLIFYWYFTANPISGKILVLQLLVKMLSANTIAGFFKIQYFKKEVNDKLYFWHADKHWSIPQVNTISLAVCNQACPKSPK